MKLDFDLYDIRTTEFGIGLNDDDDQEFFRVPIDSDVQTALQEMAIATWNAMKELNISPEMYAPSEAYPSKEYVYFPLADELANRVRRFHTAKNLPIDSNAIGDPAKISCYFVRMKDVHGKRLTAMRRATQFKGVLKSRLIRFRTDALKIIEDNVFKLDRDFDFLIDASNVHIFRPSGFEFIGNLQEAVFSAVQTNIREIQSDLNFVDLAYVQDYASNHSRAARYLASIRSQNQTANIDKTLLLSQCAANGVEIAEVDDKVKVQEGQVLGFLEVLDRRRYEVKLVRESSERFKASARKKIR